ncbi:hypothetical protein OS493_034517 [Desmophyllum pertusum]|uniref:EF-hand domain-containing protein n=1 Tax=Desmophyllum pertusum TaxID=174260 RepID=A0A9W9YIU0_9CNID|nr:hypothetical protein OS493_034517 [Desmophyllum pertusum]
MMESMLEKLLNGFMRHNKKKQQRLSQSEWTTSEKELNLNLAKYMIQSKTHCESLQIITFGVMVKPDEYGAGDLIHTRVPGKYLRGRDRERGVLAAVRHHLKKANYHNFHDLIAAFEYYDKDKSGKISLAELREVCIQFNLPVEQSC